MKDRHPIHAYISIEAHDAWENLADELGVSITALLEVKGDEIAKALAEDDAEQLYGHWAKAARKIDATRRKRGGY